MKAGCFPNSLPTSRSLTRTNLFPCCNHALLEPATNKVSKEIWLGPILGNNRERLLARCAEYFSNGQGNRLLYVAASHPLLDLVTEKLFDGRGARGVWGEFPVYLFRGLVRRILSEARASARAIGASEP